MFASRVVDKLVDLNKFFENREYIASDYLTYADFMVNERLLLVNAFS